MPKATPSPKRTAVTGPDVMPTESTSVTRVTIELPTALAKHYEEQASAWDRTLESELEMRLQRCKNYVSTSPLYFTDDQRRELEAALGHNVSNPDVVLAQLKNAVTLTVDHIDVELAPRVQQRLRSRVFRGESYEGNVKKWVVKALRIEAGLDPR